jgi:hypothetical protein
MGMGILRTVKSDQAIAVNYLLRGKCIGVHICTQQMMTARTNDNYLVA